MLYLDQIKSFQADCAQEESDQRLILAFAADYPDTILTRDNGIAHITSSGFILNTSMTKTLMVHHNIYNTWTWTGGHADGQEDLLEVALREAREETGIFHIKPICGQILSLDILPVWGHMKRGEYVSAHLHLSVAYVLIADEGEKLTMREEENSGVKWVPLEDMEAHSREPDLIEVYHKLIRRARACKESG